MYTSSSFPPLAALISLAQAHGVILGAQGDAGSPLSIGFQVNEAIARNCTTINPCQMDATIIRDAEIKANLVNKCGRTQLTGNIDIGENTENALAINAVTQVKKGSKVTVTIHQVNADGAGPYVCDLDETSNSGLIEKTLLVENNVPGVNGFSQAKAQDFNITVTMPDDLNCTGASTGDVCTVRCRNNAVAGPFGGCFAVQQTDITPKVNTPENIATALTIEEAMFEMAQNQKDLPAAIQANQNAGASEAEQNVAGVEALLGTPVTTAFPQQTPDAALGGTIATSAAAPATTTAATGRNRGGNRGNNGNNANTGAANGNNGGTGAANGNTGNTENGAANGRGRNNNNNQNQNQNQNNNNANNNVNKRAVGPGKRFIVDEMDG
ncbi:hypothetical protein B0T14DRAFT_325295 [Immersiella caudata]|uniref:GEgh 16 protein n=1 Tax=Immersiella caudata TaxID=314043 RepID=A0AA39WB08_9PEZI|nr:hypothetical protein B0T14DRAFT_325295 [Immersiella caudata]